MMIGIATAFELTATAPPPSQHRESIENWLLLLLAVTADFNVMYIAIYTSRVYMCKDCVADTSDRYYQPLIVT